MASTKAASADEADERGMATGGYAGGTYTEASPSAILSRWDFAFERRRQSTFGFMANRSTISESVCHFTTGCHRRQRGHLIRSPTCSGNSFMPSIICGHWDSGGHIDQSLRALRCLFGCLGSSRANSKISPIAAYNPKARTAGSSIVSLRSAAAASSFGHGHTRQPLHAVGARVSRP